MGGLTDDQVAVAHQHSASLPDVSRAQRFSFLGIAVVIAIVAVVLLTSGGDDEPDTTSATATATPTPTATATPTPAETETPTPTPDVPLVDASSGEVTDLEFKEGDTVRFRVTSDVADEVHVHGYDLMKDVEPGQTVTFSFPASITGIFEVELEDAGKQIAQLRVDP
jgi:heme/copper-type cytochrome/quinol oxidase subunit 2